MTLSRRRLPRRGLLVGAGVTLTLPWLESIPGSLAPRNARAAGVEKKRFVNVFMPHGAAAPVQRCSMK